MPWRAPIHGALKLNQGVQSPAAQAVELSAMGKPVACPGTIPVVAVQAKVVDFCQGVAGRHKALVCQSLKPSQGRSCRAGNGLFARVGENGAHDVHEHGFRGTHTGIVEAIRLFLALTVAHTLVEVARVEARVPQTRGRLYEANEGHVILVVGQDFQEILGQSHMGGSVHLAAAVLKDTPCLVDLRVRFRTVQKHARIGAACVKASRKPGLAVPEKGAIDVARKDAPCLVLFGKKAHGVCHARECSKAQHLDGRLQKVVGELFGQDSGVDGDEDAQTFPAAQANTLKKLDKKHVQLVSACPEPALKIGLAQEDYGKNQALSRVGSKGTDSLPGLFQGALQILCSPAADELIHGRPKVPVCQFLKGLRSPCVACSPGIPVVPHCQNVGREHGTLAGKGGKLCIAP